MAYFCRTRNVHGAIGNSEKLLIAIRNDDMSVSEFKLQAVQVAGKTEDELMTAGNAWLIANGYPELSGAWGVHIRADNGEFVIWTGAPPDVWPEFVTGTF